MRGTKLAVTLAVSAMLFAGCGMKNQEAVIKVNDTVITKAQYDKLFDAQVSNSAFAKLGINVKEDQNGFMYLMIKERVLNELVVRALLDAEIANRGIKVTKKDVDDAVKEIIERVGSKEQLNALLKQNGVSSSQFRKDLQEQVKMKKLAETLGSSEVSDAEAEKFYKENQAQFKYPEQVRASHILISANPDEIQEIITSDSKNKDLTPEQVKAKVNSELADRKAKAEKLYNEAKANIDGFAKLAKANSDDTASAEKGGDLGFFAKSDMVPEFANAAFAQSPNSIAPLVQSQFGYHIILVTDRKEAGQRAFESVKTDIKNYLTNEKQLKLLDDLTESLKKNAKIEYMSYEYDPKSVQEAVQKQVQEQTKQLQQQAGAGAKN